MFELGLKCGCVSHANDFRADLPRQSRFYIPEAKPHYAPDRWIDVEHLRLDLTVDLKKKLLSGTCTTRYKTTAAEVTKLTFDAIDLKISKVTDGQGQPIEYSQDDAKVTLHWDSAKRAGETGEIIFHYAVTEPRAGLYFIAPDENYPNRPWQLWTQGQDQDNRYWIPCHDAPNEKATTEMVVTVDENLMAISNGALLETKHDKAKKQKTFHWKQALPHASYLITLCVGEFVEIKDSWTNSKGEKIPVQYFTIKGREEETKVSFEKTPKMLEFFSKKIGVDYPYEKYAQVVAWDFIYGGMENTSSTTQTEYTLHPRAIDREVSSEPLVAHELAHQWFGDLLTCKEWSHAWLNEGFATYFESLWMEHEHGKDEFLYEVFLNERAYLQEDRAYRRPIVTNVYLAPSDIFDRHLYEKGARVLHMLRRMVGDELWWKSIRHYVTANRAKTVETVDLQRAFEETTGRALAWFFDQWAFHGGQPELKASSEWDDAKKTLKISVAQKQKTDELTPQFRFPLQIKTRVKGNDRFFDLEMNAAEQTLWIPCEEKPEFVSLNPENTVLGTWEFKPGRDMLIAQLKGDADCMGRIFAAKTLAKDHARDVVEALGAALRTEKFWGVQAEICESLALIGSPLAVEHLAEAVKRLEHPRARARAVRALGSLKNPKMAETFEAILQKESSPLVQYEAGAALGKTKSKEAFEKLGKMLGRRESWHDYHDRGILLGLCEFKHEERAAEILEKKTRVGESMFLRRDALNALARWGESQPNKVIERVLDLTRDENFFVRVSSVNILADYGDERAMGALRKVADSVVEPRTRRSAILAQKALREGRAASEETGKLKASMDQLQEQYRELLGRFEKLEKNKPA